MNILAFVLLFFIFQELFTCFYVHSSDNHPWRLPQCSGNTLFLKIFISVLIAVLIASLFYLALRPVKCWLQSICLTSIGYEDMHYHKS
jgi:hypothetical protein